MQGVSQKIKTADVSQNWEIRVVFTESCNNGWLQEKFLWVQPRKHWKMPTWEGTISEHDIIQHTQITTDNFFFFVYHKLGWDTE